MARGFLGILLLGSTLAGTATAQVTVTDVIGSMSLAQFNAFINNRAYKDWGNEPYVAVNPLDPRKIVISGFAFSSNGPSNSASVWYSTNGGASWALTFPMQSPIAGVTIPRDQNFAYDGAGNLHVAVLGSSGTSFNVYHGVTSDPSAPASFTWTAGTVNHVGINNADQPAMSISGTHVYIAYDNFSNGGVEERVARSDDGGATFKAADDIAISRGGPIGSSTNPGTRIATDANGNAYSIFGIGTGTAGLGEQNVTWRLNSYHLGVSGSSWDHTNDTANPGGILIDSGKSHQIDGTGATWFGGVNQLRGNTTAIASTLMGDHIYALYGKEDASGLDRLYIQEYHPGAGTSLIGSGSVLFSVAGQRAALPSIAVANNGTIGIEYDSYVGPGGNPLAPGGTFQLHFDMSTDGGLTFSDQVLYSWTAPGAPGDPNYGTDRELGDFQKLYSLDNTFYGTFAARGSVNAGGINTTNLISPFYFSVPAAAVPEPASVVMSVQVGLAGVGLVVYRRRRRRRPAAA